ncbi:transcriptional coactivator p15/PC4 family protein [Pelagibius sp. Alg239-R121]|uniref:transcriptional coactivator p15/PC4 family protein n=1 Tax=Pelagibius sp. Alg239-R121 TaxID=2993448 RepID=UPI0024A693BF|nr:transcriptional coactivator p15/PC4 family protein [Pelagibius sp. Alg239-R121]
MSSEDTGQDIAVIPKNSREQIRISLSEFMDFRLVNIRVFTDDGAQWIPTKKGLSIRVERLRDLQEALRKAEYASVRAGLLSEIQEATQ